MSHTVGLFGMMRDPGELPEEDDDVLGVLSNPPEQMGSGISKKEDSEVSKAVGLRMKAMGMPSYPTGRIDTEHGEGRIAGVIAIALGLSLVGFALYSLFSGASNLDTGQSVVLGVLIVIGIAVAGAGAFLYGRAQKHLDDSEAQNRKMDEQMHARKAVDKSADEAYDSLNAEQQAEVDDQTSSFKIFSSEKDRVRS